MKIRTSQKTISVVFSLFKQKNNQEEGVSILRWSYQIRCIFEIKSLDACGRRGALLLSQTLQQRMLINHQTNWVWGNLPSLWQWKRFVWKNCLNHTLRHSQRAKRAPGCPKPTSFSLQKYKYARKALEMATANLHVLEQIVYWRPWHSPERRRQQQGVTVIPSTNRQTPSAWQTGKEWCNANGQIVMIVSLKYRVNVLFFPNNRSWLWGGFSYNQHSASLTFWQEWEYFLKKKKRNKRPQA